MALTKQVHLYSIATDAFYEPDEKFIHERLLKLYKLRQSYDESKQDSSKRKKKPPDWKIESKSWRKPSIKSSN